MSSVNGTGAAAANASVAAADALAPPGEMAASNAVPQTKAAVNAPSTSTSTVPNPIIIDLDETEETMEKSCAALRAWYVSDIQSKADTMAAALSIMNLLQNEVHPTMKRVHRHLDGQSPPKRMKTENSTKEEDKKRVEDDQKDHEFLMRLKERSGHLISLTKPVDEAAQSCREWMETTNLLLNQQEKLPGMRVPNVTCGTKESDKRFMTLDHSRFLPTPINWLTANTADVANVDKIKIITVDMTSKENQIYALRILQFYGRLFQTCWEHAKALLVSIEPPASLLVEDPRIAQCASWVCAKNVQDQLKKAPQFVFNGDDASQEQMFMTSVQQMAATMKCEHLLCQPINKGNAGMPRPTV
jgi:hypothetical protein